MSSKLKKIGHFFAGTPLIHRQIVKNLNLKPKDSILDIGCGTGSLLLRIAKDKRFKKVELSGIDANPEAMAEAKIALVPYHAMVKIAMADDLPFTDQEFDKVILVFTIHHLPEEMRQKAIKEAFRVLRLGGEIHITELMRPVSISGWLLSSLSLSHRCNYRGVVDQVRHFLNESGFVMIQDSNQFGHICHIRASKPESLARPRTLKLIS